jgi:uncharacterized protein YdeI (YjbR/CyaY-like superfamily)
MRFTPRSRKAWRNWLERNHATAAEVWLVYYKRHTGKATVSYGDSVEEALCFGWIDGVRRAIDEERYEHRFSPRKPNSDWSEINKRRVAKLTAAGLMTPAGQSCVNEAKRNGRWSEPRKPPPRFEASPELEAALESNRRAAEHFAALAPSYRHQYVGWIASAKRDETRRRRIEEAIALLERGEKLGMR